MIDPTWRKLILLPLGGLALLALSQIHTKAATPEDCSVTWEKIQHLAGARFGSIINPKPAWTKEFIRVVSELPSEMGDADELAGALREGKTLFITSIHPHPQTKHLQAVVIVYVGGPDCLVNLIDVPIHVFEFILDRMENTNGK
jgi:hypothetical protein